MVKLEGISKLRITNIGGLTHGFVSKLFKNPCSWCREYDDEGNRLTSRAAAERKKAKSLGGYDED